MRNYKSGLLFFLVLIIALIASVACNPLGSEKLKVEFKNPSVFKNLKSQVSNVSIVNNQLIVSGSRLSGVISAKLKNNSQEEVFQVESASDTQIIANGTKLINLIAGSAFDLILSDASGAATFAVTFSLDNGSITGDKLSSMGASNGQILKYTTLGGWAPASFASSQNYISTWNATTNVPDITSSIGAYNPGDYFIVSTAGSFLGFPCAVGDWVMFNGLTLQWDKIVNSSIGSTGTASYIPYYSSASGLANSPMYVLSGKIGIGTLTPAASLDVKGTFNLSGATSGYVGFAPAAVAGSTTYTLPTGPGTSGQVLTTNGVASTPTLSWTSVSVSGGTVTSVASANGDIVVTNGTTTADLAVNTGTGANQIVKLTAASKLPAVDGSLLTSLASANLTGTVAVANGGTGAATLGASQSALGITIAGPLIGNVPALGVGVVASRLCASDVGGSTISCTNNLPTSVIENSVVSKSGTGNLLFGTGPTITSPVITNIAPAANFSLTQNGVVPFASENTGAVANTLYLKQGDVGIGTTSPNAKQEILSTTEQLRLSYDATHSLSFAVNSGGQATLTQTGPFPIIIGASQGIDTAGFYVRSLLSVLNKASSNWVTWATRNTSGAESVMDLSNIGSITTNGNVGIGTATPTASLEVNGDIRLTSAGQRVTIGDTYSWIRRPNSGIAGDYTWINGTGGVVLSSGMSLTGTPRLLVGSNGYVGIGTTTPTTNLDVVGSGKFTGSIGAFGGIDMQHTAIGRADYISTDSSSGLTLDSSDASGSLKFQVAGSEKVRINSSGNVGIGTSAPTYALDVVGQIKTRFSGNLTGITIGNNGSDAPKIEFNQSDNSKRFWMQVNSINSATERLSFYAGPLSNDATSETMVIGGNGNVGIGTTTPNSKLEVNGTVRSTNQELYTPGTDTVSQTLYYGNSAVGGISTDSYNLSVGTDATGGQALAFRTAGTERMRIMHGSGNVGIGTTSPNYKLDVSGTLNVSGATTNASDIRFKKDIVRIPDALEKLLSLDGVFYNYRTDEFPERNFTDRRVMGVIAQKVEKVFPEAVSKDDKGFRSVAYSMLIAPIIEAVRSLDKKVTELFTTLHSQSRVIASLNAKTTKLEIENAELKARLDKIEKILLRKK